MTRPVNAAKIFNLHDDIRHIIIADSMGAVLEIHSRAKKQWPQDVQRQFSGIMAAVTFGLSEKIKEIAGEIEHITVTYEKMKIIIIRSSKYFYIVSARRNLPNHIIDELINLMKKEG
ncbi:roadblock/LC7 domain-containing protein [Candidatus Bathyarchaeota archaeon]|nr:roadblock/LC7 domain-containing protein [Candidatus Bathyarchaeota archaeon]